MRILQPRRPGWTALIVATVLSLLLLAVVALPVGAVVKLLLFMAHQEDPRVPDLTFGAVWCLTYAFGVLRAFMHADITITFR